MKTVATNLSINHLNRYRARWRFFSEEEHPPEIAVAPEAGRERQEALELAIQKLPKLGISLAKVKTDIRGRETLKKARSQKR